MKSLQILPSLDVGGVERGVIDMARFLRQRGEDMVVISSGGPLVDELHKLGVPHYTLPVHRKSIFSLKLVDEIARIIRREGIDLVHGRSRVPAWLAYLAAKKAEVPFITTCHGYYSAHLLSRVMGWGKRVIVISRVVGRHMIDDFGVAPDRIRLVHRGIDLSQFQFRPGKYEQPKKVLRIVNVGRLSPIKGHLEFLKAVHKLRRDFPAIEVWIVGSEGKGKTHYTEQLQKMISQLGLENCVTLAGKRRDIPDILAGADLLVLSTLVPEAFGRVIVEAGAVGTAVVATRVGGVLDIIDDGENGFLVPPGDIDGMADAMLKLLGDRKLAGVFAERLRRKIEASFSLEQMVEKTLAVYREARQEKRILILKLGALGDLVLATPSFRMIRNRFPDAHIALAVDKKFASLVTGCPYLNEIIPLDRKKISRPWHMLRLAKKFRKEGFDISIDMQNSKWTHLLAWFSGVTKRYGFRRGKTAFLLNRGEAFPRVPEEPVRNQYRILSRLGIKVFDDRLELWPDERSRQKVREWFGGQTRPFAGLVIGSSPKWPSKRWPLEFFRELALRLVEECGVRIALIGSPEDKDLAARFSEGLGCDILDLTGRTEVRDLPAVMERLDVLVTGDTAPLHVAAACGTPVAALFGPTDPRRHMPPAVSSVTLVRHMQCQPCYSGECRNREKMACLKKISVDEVLEAVKSLLGAGRPVTHRN